MTASPAAEASKSVVEAVDADGVVELVRAATQIPSVTPNERQFAEWVGEQLSDGAWDEVELFDCEPGRPNVWADVGGGRGSGTGGDSDADSDADSDSADGSTPPNSLLLAGHLDTVGVDDWLDEWKDTPDPRADPFGAHIIDGEIWGRGVADQKAGICVIIEAVRAIRRAGFAPAAKLSALFVCDEESGQPGSGVSQGMKAAMGKLSPAAQPAPAFAIYTEPTTSAIYTAQMGFLIADISLHGKSAYFGRPELGLDALKAGHQLLSALWQHSEELGQLAPHKLLGEAFLLVISVSSGGNIAVPGRFDLSLIRKILPQESLDEAAEAITAIAEQTAADTGTKAEISFSAPRDHKLGGTPNEIDESHPAVLALADSIAATTGRKASIQGAPFWSEKSFFARAKIPSVYFAPGDISHCHTPFERLATEELVRATRTMAHFISCWCQLKATPKGS